MNKYEIDDFVNVIINKTDGNNFCYWIDNQPYLAVIIYPFEEPSGVLYICSINHDEKGNIISFTKPHAYCIKENDIFNSIKYSILKDYKKKNFGLSITNEYIYYDDTQEV